MTRARLTMMAALTLGATGIAAVAGYFAWSDLARKVDRRLEHGWVLSPLELYSRGLAVTSGRQFPREDLERELAARKLDDGRDYGFDSGTACAPLVSADRHCLWLREPALVATWDDRGFTREVWLDGAATDHAAVFPRLITQFFDGQPILRENIALGDVPLACLQAVTAIEDREFLEHRGVSATGTARAILRNLRQGRWAEGGSTITQQLVKNFFLTPKKTLRRKIEEQGLALLLESRVPKDQILEMYLNVIYMGQSGPYQVRGFGSAARTYFDRPVADLTLPECALLAAMINSPGRFSPSEHPAAARARRELVLHKMRAAEMITAADESTAVIAPLPAVVSPAIRPHAPYFVTSALREFRGWDLDADAGARLYTTLDADAQNAVTRALDATLPLVAKRVRRTDAPPLEAAIVTIDVARAEIIALVGGRDFHASPYNRATDSRRQIGSLVKPFVYLPAVRAADPLASALDEPFDWTVGAQKWRPRNYEKASLGPVPYFYALAHSLNVPTARVGREVGLDVIAGVIADAGIRATVPRLPSLTLGAFELSLAEIAQGYTTLARLGQGEFVHTLAKVEAMDGETVFERQATSSLRLDPVATAVVNGMLRQTVEIGTARAVRAAGLDGDYAGKTGTTSDTKDAWFVGFDGRLLTAVWVGFDDNSPLGLTGATAALPLWIEVTRNLRRVYEPRAWTVPDGAEDRTITRGDILARFPSLERLPEQVRLTFARR